MSCEYFYIVDCSLDRINLVEDLEVEGGHTDLTLYNQWCEPDLELASNQFYGLTVDRFHVADAAVEIGSRFRMGNAGHCNTWSAGLNLFYKHPTYKQRISKMQHETILEKVPTTINHASLEGLLEIRTLTGVTRISEHHLVNGLSSHAEQTNVFLKFLDKDSSSHVLNELLDTLAELGYLVEMRPTELGLMAEATITLNAFYKEPVNGRDVQTNLLHLCIRNGNSEIIHYYARGYKQSLSKLFNYLKPWTALKPVLTNYVCGFGDNGPVVDKREIELDHHQANRVFYPQLENIFPTKEGEQADPIEQLAAAFEMNTSNLLFLIGTPGTGKSTLIRWLCGQLRHRQIYQFAGDQTIKNPNFDTYLSMLPKDSLVIIEDADDIVGKRTDGNRTMTTLLNEIDGVASKGIKFIISTNLPTTRDVDEALLRPGRLAYSIEFRKLSVDELKEVARELGIFREITGPMSLADFLAPAQAITAPKTKGIGF